MNRQTRAPADADGRWFLPLARAGLLRAGIALAAVTLVLSAAAPHPARAFSPGTRAASLAGGDVPRKGGDLRADGEGLRVAGAELAPFMARHGGAWQVERNPWTGTPHMVVGSGVQWSAGPIATEAAAENEARRFFTENPSLLAVATDRLAVEHVTHAMGKWSIIFGQRAAGLRVVGGRAHAVFTEGGRLFAFGSDCFPGVSVNPEPVVSPAAALRAAIAGTAWDGAGDQITRQDLVILPIAEGEGLEYRLAYFLTLRIDTPPAAWDTWVDATTGEILWRVNQVRTEVSGTVEAETQYVGYCDGVTTLPDRNMYVTVTGQGTATTDTLGAFHQAVTGSGPFTLNAAFEGPWVNVDVYGGGDARYSTSVSSGAPVTVHFDSTNARHDERDCFYNVNRIHDWMKTLDPGFTGQDYEMPCTVKRTDGYCPGNAWYDGWGINFCDSSATAANTGEIGNVVYHEYGHGITAQIYGFAGPGGDLHEGNSDVVACYLENTPIVGRGFYKGQCDRGIRNLDNSMQYPGDLSGEGHHDGQIIGGFCWQTWIGLRSLLGAEAGSDRAWHIWHYSRRLGLPQSQPDQVLWSFIADDDDGNLANGTPFYDVLCQAAEHHHFDCPAITEGVMIAHTPASSKTTSDPTLITASISSTQAALVADSLRVWYRVDGGAWASAVMTPAGPAGNYQATIPGEPQNAQIDYYIRGVDAAGNDRNDPGLAPYAYHTYDIAYAFEAFEGAAPGWQVGAADDTATGGIWVLADPVGTVCQPEDDHTPAGTRCWITANGTPGGAPGEADVDGGKTTLFSPSFNLAGATTARLRYYRWYNNYYGGSAVTDTWKVDVSNDGGVNWVNGETQASNRRAWDLVTIDVGALFGAPETVRVRFVASDYAFPSVIEAGVDDFEVLAAFGATAVEAAPVTTTGVPGADYIAAQPNPFNPKTTIRYGLAAAGPVELRIYSVGGALVKTLVATSQPAGHYALVWNGTNEAGRVVEGGIYFARLTAGAGGATRVSKLVLAK